MQGAQYQPHKAIRERVLSGWLAADFLSEKDDESAANILMGYCLESIANSFRLMKKKTKLEQQFSQTKLTQRFSDLETCKKDGLNRKRTQRTKAVENFKKALQSMTESGDIKPLEKIIQQEDITEFLFLKEKVELLRVLVNMKMGNNALAILRTAKDKSEFASLLKSIDGRKTLQFVMRDEDLGRFLYLMERFGCAV